MPITRGNPDYSTIQRCLTLARKECCNFMGGSCVETGGSCHLIANYPSIHDGALGCDWFLAAVLPLDQELWKIVRHEIGKEETLDEDEETSAAEEPTLRCCTICGKEFIPVTHNQKYCASCREEGKRRNARKRIRRFRGQSEKKLG